MKARSYIDGVYESMDQLLRPYLERITKRPDPMFSFQKMIGDASSREYFRIDLSNCEHIDSLVLMKFQPENAFSSDEVGAGMAAAHNTFPFSDVLAYLESGGVSVPMIYLQDLDQGLVFLEDLGDRQMFSIVRDADVQLQREWYTRAIDLMMDFQRLTFNKPDPSCIAFRRRFDYDLLMWECEHYLEYGIEARYNLTIPEKDRTEIRKSFDYICSKLLNTPQIVVHRDFQSKNLMANGDHLVLIDFQDSLIGPLPYDLVALLRDSYVVLDQPMIDEMVDYYLKLRKETLGLSFDREEFFNAFLLQTVQRKLKDAGRFIFIDQVKNNPSFLQYIPDSLDYAKWAMTRLPELSPLIGLLGRYEERLKP